MTDTTIDATKTDLASVIDRVERGETVSLTSDGAEIARVVPSRRSDPERLIDEVRGRLASDEELTRTPVTAEEIVSWIAEGRR
jgi:prevent-host-death family protein